MDEENKTEQTVEKIKRIDFTFYSNLAMVSCSESDFFIDFMQGPPEGEANANKYKKNNWCCFHATTQQNPSDN